MAAHEAIVWDSGKSPLRFCAENHGVGSTVIEYGYPTYFECIGNGVKGFFTPSCATEGYIPDFEYQRCVPTESALDVLLALSVNDALVIAGAVLLLWSVAWGLRVIRQSVVTYNERSENE